MVALGWRFFVRYLAAFLFQMSVLIMAESAAAQALGQSPAPTDQALKKDLFQNWLKLQQHGNKLNDLIDPKGIYSNDRTNENAEKIDYCAHYHFPWCPDGNRSPVT